MPSGRPPRWLRWTVAAVAAVAVLAVGGTYVYIHFIEGPAPAPFSLKSAATASSAPASPSARATGAGQATSPAAAGTWQVAAGSQAGYRVKEVLLGQNNIAVGRTSHVNGHLTIKGSTVTAAAWSSCSTSPGPDRPSPPGQDRRSPRPARPGASARRPAAPAWPGRPPAAGS